MTIRIGVVGDSHCQSVEELHSSVTDALEGCDHIVHLGDVSTIDILDRLEEIAPVTGVTSKTDPEDRRLQGTERWLELGSRRLAVRRSLVEGEVFPDDIQIVLHGGTHDHSVRVRDGRLFVNPGSTRWAQRAPSLAILTLDETIGASVEVVPVVDG